LDQRRRTGVEPVAIIDHDDHAAMLRTGSLERAHQLVKQAFAQTVTLATGNRGALLEQLHQHRVGRAYQARAKQGKPRRIGRTWTRLGRGGLQQPPARQLRRCRVQEARLAHAGLGLDQEYTQGCEVCAQESVDTRELARSPDQRRRLFRAPRQLLLRLPQRGLARFSLREPRAEQTLVGARLLLGLACAAARVQQLHEERAGRGVERVQIHQLTRERQGSLGPRAEARQQRGEHFGVQAPQLLALGQAPDVIGVEVAQLETFQQLAAKQRERALQRGGRGVLDPAPEQTAHLQRVHADVAAVERDLFAIGDQARSPGLVHQLSQLAQAPAQRGARIVGDVQSRPHSFSRRWARPISAR
jgi:hypothetical protein